MDRLIGLVLLRWRMDLRGLRRTPERLAGLVVLVPFLALSRRLRDGRRHVGARTLGARDPALLLPLASMLATLIGFFWMVSPMLTGLALGETHDLSRLLIFPIPFWNLVASSLLANLLQPLVLAKMPVVMGLALGLAGSPATVPFTARRRPELRLHAGGGAAIVPSPDGAGAQPALPGRLAVPRHRARLRHQHRAPGPALGGPAPVARR